VPDAAVWLEGRKFTADAKTGRIIIPFTAQPGQKKVVLADATGSFASLATLDQPGESYNLATSMHLEREQLLARREATLVIRADLTASDAPAPLSLLQDLSLTVVTNNLDGVPTTTVVKDLKLEAAKDYTYTFRVPDRVQTVTATLQAKIANISKGGEKQPLIGTHEWQINGIDSTATTGTGFLSRFGPNYVWEVLGKNGEPLSGQVVTLHL